MSVWSKRNINGSIIVIVAVLVTNFIYLLLSLFLVHNISVEHFATFTTINSIFLFFSIFTHSIGLTIQQKISRLIGNGYSKVLPTKKFTKNILYTATIVGIIWLLITPWISDLLQINEEYAVLLVTPVLFVAFFQTIQESILRGNFLLKHLSLLLISEALIKITIGFIGVVTENIFLVFASLPISLSASLLISALSTNNILGKEKAPEIAKFSRKFFQSVFIIGIVNSTFLITDIILVKIFFDPITAGYYAILSIIGKIMIVLGNLPTQFILSFVSYEKSSKRNSYLVFNIMFGAVLMITTSAYIFILLTSNLLLPFIFGENTENIIDFVPLYTFAVILYIFTNTTIINHLAQKNYKIKMVPILTLVITVVGIIFFHKSLWDVILILILANGIGFLFMVIYHNQQMKKVKLRNTFLLFTEILNLFKKINLPKGKKNILFFNWRDIKHKDSGGAEKYIYEIGSNLSKKGFGVIWFTSNDGNNSPIEKINDITIIRKGGFITVYIFAILYYIFHLKKRVDVIVDCQNGIPFFTPIYCKKPIILLVHHIHQKIFKDYLPFGLAQFAMFLEKDLMKFIYNNKQIITVSPSTKKDLINLGFKNKNIEIIYNGVENPKQNTQVKKSKTPLVLYLGRLKKYKRVDWLIEAFKYIENGKLIIAGEGSEKRNLEKITKELKLEKKVKFKGYIDEENKKELLSNAWVVVQPSKHEGWSITNLEANSHQTPCIGFNVSGIKDSIVDGEIGILCEIESVENMAKNIALLLNNDNLRSKLSQNAFEFSKKFTWEKSGEKFEKLIINL